MTDKRFYLILFVAAGLVCLLPLGLGVYHLHVMIVSLFYVMMASSWNLLAGYTGQVSFAHAAFAGIGAYTSGILAAKFGVNPWLGVIIGAFLAALLGLGVGVLCLRMGGIYLSLTTLGFSEILRIVITNEYEITRGTMGLQVPGLVAEYSKTAYLYIMLGGAIVTLIALYKLIYSDIGLNFRAVQNDERAAASLGVNVVRMRVLAFTVSSALAGMAGGLYRPLPAARHARDSLVGPTVPRPLHDRNRRHGLVPGDRLSGPFPWKSSRNTFVPMVSITSWCSVWWPWWWRDSLPTASWGLRLTICRVDSNPERPPRRPLVEGEGGLHRGVVGRSWLE